MGFYQLVFANKYKTYKKKNTSLGKKKTWNSRINYFLPIIKYYSLIF